jgi:hypothetical protein
MLQATLACAVFGAAAALPRGKKVDSIRILFSSSLLVLSGRFL